MNNRLLLGASLTVIFAVTMMIAPISANGDGLSITKPSFDEFSMQANGPAGQTTDGHDIVVYAFLTDTSGEAENSIVAFVAAVHPSFVDDNEQKKDATAIHAHALELETESGNLCVVGLAKNPTVNTDGNEVRINGGHGNIVANAIAGYDITDDGICLTELYDIAAP